MPCVLILRRKIRVNGPGEPDNRRGHVVEVVKEILPAHSLKSRGHDAIIDVSDMGEPAARRLFIEKDYSAYIGPPNPGRGGHHEKTLRQRSVRLDVEALRISLPGPKATKLVAMFTEGFYVREADRFEVTFNKLRKAFIVDRDLNLEIKADRTIGPK